MAYSGGINFEPGVGIFVKFDDENEVAVITDDEGNVLYEAEGGEA